MANYTTNTPLANETLSHSQPLIRNNFLNLESTIGLNHVAPTDATVADRGKHKWVAFKNQAGDPAVAGTDTNIYTKTVGGTSQLFWKNSASVVSQLTTNIATNNTTHGTSFLPGGMIIKWEQFTAPGGTGATYVYTFTAPAFLGGPLCVVISPFNSTASSKQPYVSTWSANTVTIKAGTGTLAGASFTLIAIGN
jgi:hypothetical protein